VVDCDHLICQTANVCFFATGGKMPCVEENFSKVAGELNRRICYEKVFSFTVNPWLVNYGKRRIVAGRQRRGW
jgi:hypothetical protein